VQDSEEDVAVRKGEGGRDRDRESRPADPGEADQEGPRAWARERPSPARARKDPAIARA
jgi:hypothetical protein